MTRFTLTPAVRRMLLDIVIVGLLYLLVEFARTEQEPVSDWTEWMRAAGFGVLYRVTPELIQVLGTVRARLGGGESPPPAQS